MTRGSAGKSRAGDSARMTPGADVRLTFLRTPNPLAEGDISSRGVSSARRAWSRSFAGLGMIFRMRHSRRSTRMAEDSV